MLGADIDGSEQNFLAFWINDDLARGGFVVRAVVVLFWAAVRSRGDGFRWIELGVDGFAHSNGIA